MKDLILYDTYKAIAGIVTLVIYFIIKKWWSKPKNRK